MRVGVIAVRMLVLVLDVLVVVLRVGVHVRLVTVGMLVAVWVLVVVLGHLGKRYVESDFYRGRSSDVIDLTRTIDRTEPAAIERP